MRVFYRCESSQKGIFVEDEWRLTDTWALTGGLRLDDHEVYGNHWSPRLYSVWHASEELTIKGGVSRGFRAPDIRTIAPGYAYTTGGASCTYGPNGTCGVKIGDPAQAIARGQWSIAGFDLAAALIGALHDYVAWLVHRHRSPSGPRR